MSADGPPDLPSIPGWVRWALRRLLSEGERRIVHAELAELHTVWTARLGRREADRRYLRQLRRYPLHLAAHKAHTILTAPRSVARDAFGARPRHAIRSLRRAPLFTTVAVLTLGVGIGGTTAIFAVVHGVLLEPLPYKDPHRLVDVSYTAPGLGWAHVGQSPALQFTEAADNHSFSSIGMWATTRGAAVTGLAQPEWVSATEVTYEVLPMLGSAPVLGREFTAEDDAPEAPQTVILSYAYWQRRFGGDRDALARTLTVQGTSRRIIGVLPEGLEFLDHEPDIWIPSHYDPNRTPVGAFGYHALARLKPGVTIAKAEADVDRLLPIAVKQHPGGLSLSMLHQGRFAAIIRPLKQQVVGDTGKVLWVLLGAVSIILLVACANVANLFLVRTEGRRQEVAIRSALGAGRRRVVGELLGESVLLGLLGGATGLVLAWGGLRVFVALGPASLPRLHDVRIDGFVLAFAFSISFVAGILFGLFPAMRHTGRLNLVSTLKESARGGDAGIERHRARRALVVAQIALALVLLTGSGLMIRSFEALRQVNPGFRSPDRVLTFRLRVPQTSDRRRALTFDAILDSIRASPGVATAALTSSVAMGGNGSGVPLESQAHPTASGQLAPIRRIKLISDGYAKTMGNTLVAGRTFTAADIEDRARVVLVTRDFASSQWGSPRAALGQRLRQASIGKVPASPWYEVVGVVGDVYDDGAAQEPVAIVYFPRVADLFGDSTHTEFSMSFVVRTASKDPGTLVPAMRKAVWAVDPNLPLANVRTLAEVVAGSMARTSFMLVMLGIAAGVALFLGLVGIYGVVSYMVARRTHEIGVRVALGAERGDVTRMVLGEALVVTGIGVALGLVAAAGLTRLMTSLLYGVGALDPLTFAVVAVTLTVVSLLASWLPARRAATVDPVRALAAP